MINSLILENNDYIFLKEPREDRQVLKNKYIYFDFRKSRHSLVELMNSASRMLHITYLRSWSWSPNGIETPIHVLIPFSCVGCGSRLETGQAAGWEAKLLTRRGSKARRRTFRWRRQAGASKQCKRQTMMQQSVNCTCCYSFAYFQFLHLNFMHSACSLCSVISGTRSFSSNSVCEMTGVVMMVGHVWRKATYLMILCSSLFGGLSSAPLSLTAVWLLIRLALLKISPTTFSTREVFLQDSS